MEIRSWLPPWIRPREDGDPEAAPFAAPSPNGASANGHGPPPAPPSRPAADAPAAADAPPPAPEPPPSPEPPPAPDPGPEADSGPEPDGMGPDAQAELRARREQIVRMEEQALRQMQSVDTQL